MSNIPDEPQALRAEIARLRIEIARLQIVANHDGFVITLTEAQASLFSGMCTALLSRTAKKQTVTQLRLGLAASDNLLKSLRRRFEKALKRGVG